MLLMMLEKGMQVDECVMFDTGWEFPQMYDHLEKLRGMVDVPITTLKPRKPFEYFFSEHVLTRGKHKGQRGYGFARPMARWCTREKVNAIEKYLRQYQEKVQYVGIAADEKRPLDPAIKYPLVEWGVTERECLDYCKRRGFDWGGLYDHFDRVSCWCCPLQPLDELRELRHSFPELWDELKAMQDRSTNTFKIKHSVYDLDRRFALEDCQMRIDWDEVNR